MSPIDNTPSVPWWRWPNLFALDAPFIALIWQQIIAQPAGPTWGESSALFFAVWAIYLADRLLDSRSLRAIAPHVLPLRHRFFRDHQRRLIFLLGVVFAAGAIAAAFLPASTIWRGVALAAGAGLYLLWNQAGIDTAARKWLKELVVASIFAIGCGLSALGTAPWDAWLTAVAVLAICGWVNCLQIASLEREFDQHSGMASQAAMPMFERLIFDFLPWIATGSFLLVIAFLGASSALVCGVVVAVMLNSTGRIGRRHGPEVGGAWADAALFFPALLVCFI